MTSGADELKRYIADKAIRNQLLVGLPKCSISSCCAAADSRALGAQEHFAQLNQRAEKAAVEVVEEEKKLADNIYDVCIQAGLDARWAPLHGPAARRTA
jgi:hypothetical protein